MLVSEVEMSMGVDASNEEVRNDEDAQQERSLSSLIDLLEE